MFDCSASLVLSQFYLTNLTKFSLTLKLCLCSVYSSLVYFLIKQERVFVTRGKGIKGGGSPLTGLPSLHTNIQDIHALVDLLVIVQDTLGRGDVRVPIEE